jgi:hypothetical protein
VPRRLKNRIGAVCLFVLGPFVGFSADAPVFHPKPVWNVADAPCRLMVEKGRDDFFLVRLPVRVGDRPVAAVRVFESTNESSARVVWADTNALTVLVDARLAKRTQLVRVYPVPGEKPIAVSATGAVDPTPLRGCARRTAGMDFPATLADVGMLETRCDTKSEWFDVEDFGKLPATFKSWFKGDWTRKNHLVDLQTWLAVPSDGRYLFGLAGVAPAWLVVDGAPALTHPAGRPFDAWTAGAPLPLKAGLHRIQVRTVCRQEIDTGVAWKRDGEAGVAATAGMVTGGDLHEGRWEWRDRRVHAFAEAESGQAYRFLGTDETFVPFVLTDRSSCWGTNAVTRWELDGAFLGEGASLAVTLKRSSLPARLTVRTRAASGEEDVYATRLAYDGPVWSQVEVSSRVTGVPAACYDDDRVQPIIRIRTTADDGLDYALETETVTASGACERQTQAVKTEKGWARVYLRMFEAGSVSNVTWTLRHAGVAVSRGRAAFLREPFAVLPDSVSGESLKAGDAFVVLVASKAFKDEADASENATEGTNGVVFFDGFVYTAAGCRWTSSAAHGLFKSVVDLPSVEGAEDASGMSLLLPFVAVKPQLPASTMVLAPSLQSISREGGSDAFERRLSALTGLLSSPACGSPRVLLVVPPAFDVLPGCGCVPGSAPCIHAALARAYAERVIRVADAQGVETVDLFTAFRTAGASGGPLVKNGALTPEGVALAESLIRKKLESEP